MRCSNIVCLGDQVGVEVVAAAALRTGELVRLLADAQPQALNLNAVYTSRKHMPATLRSMLDFLAQRFTDEPEWDKDLL